MNIKEIDGIKYVTYDEHQKTVIMAIQLERQACWNICDNQMEKYLNHAMIIAAGNCADSIRARGE